MTDHLAEARRITEGQTAYDSTALSCGILHALIAIAERMGEPRPGVLLTTEPEPDPVADALDEMAARQAEPECPHEGCCVMEVHSHYRHSTPPATPPAVPCSLACGDGGQSTVEHVRGSTALTRCYRPRARQEGGR